MNLLRNPSRRMSRGQPPLMRHYWLHRSLHRHQEAREGESAADEASQLTESGEPAPDDQT